MFGRLIKHSYSYYCCCCCFYPGTRVKVSISTDYRNETEGLCGNYNGNSMDDIAVDGISVPVEEFGTKWKTATGCPDAVGPTEFPPCRVSPVKITVALRGGWWSER